MNIRLFIMLLIMSVFFFSNLMVSLAAVPQACMDADNHINLRAKKNLYTKCIYSGKLSENESSIYYTKRGIAYEYLGESKLAIKDYDSAILTNSKYYDAYIQRGIIYFKLDDFKHAIKDFEKALELRPNYSKAYNNLAWVLATSRDPQHRDGERALKLIETALQLSKIDNFRILDTLAAVYAEMGQFDKAIDAQLKSIKIAEEIGEEDAVIKLRDALSDYKRNRTHYTKSTRNSLIIK